jgi:hypothetical protein
MRLSGGAALDCRTRQVEDLRGFDRSGGSTASPPACGEGGRQGDKRGRTVQDEGDRNSDAGMERKMRRVRARLDLLAGVETGRLSGSRCLDNRPLRGPRRRTHATLRRRRVM